ncbi:MAG TPA: thioesterase family protein [Candidatus Limnocylindria bacterium]|nr:thioesterase family protein [Candidatus Limnocylindria bacterium]
MADPLVFSQRWKVRTYEVDENGHVNNAVYLQWAEQLTAEHAEAAGFGREWSVGHDGAWFVRRHEIRYHRPARRGDEVELTVRVVSVGGVRGSRRTEIRHAASGQLLAEVASDWVWVRLSDGRPSRVPPEILAAFRVPGQEPMRTGRS